MVVFLLYIIIGVLVFSSTLIMMLWFKTNRILNFYLIFVSIILCIYLIIYGLSNLKFNEFSIVFFELSYYQVILILIPAVYLFFQKLIFNTKHPIKKDLFNFIFPLILFKYFSIQNFDILIQKSILVLLGFLVYIIYYVYKSYLILNKYVWDNNYYDLLSPIVKNWAVFIFNMQLVVLSHFLTFFIVQQFFSKNLSIKMIVDGSLLIVFLIGYCKVIFSPVLFYGNSMIESIKEDNRDKNIHINKVWKLILNKEITVPRDIQIFSKIEDKIIIYIEQIEEIAVVNCSFRKKNYSLHDLSLESGLPKYYLEFIFKYYCKVTFSDYKKIVRIYDAVKLINEGYLASNTLDSLSKKVGFASYNPFLINFKEILGISPFDYYKSRTILNNNFIP